ncbi:MAG: hypothetical protein HY717_13065 [Planctomycetes bacterium]|nr:hypothetical protein [Planctomycetota bacterium]
MMFKEPQQVAATAPVSRLTAPPQREPAGAAEGCAAAGANGASVLVQHGIHFKSYPVAGMTVAQVRGTLSAQLHIDPASVAVIGGVIVDDENARVVTGKDQLLTFTKRSSVRGCGR